MKIKTRGNKLVSTLLAIALVFGLFATVPLTASAANVNVSILDGDYVDEIKTKVQNAIDASSSGDTVTVIGNDCDQIGDTMSLNIKAGVTVVWKIGYGCPISVDCLVNLTGDGTFEVADGGALMIHDNGTAIEGDSGVTVIVNGGTVSTGDGVAICADNIEVSGGVVHSNEGYAIYAMGMGATVTVSGGTVTTGGEKPTIYSRHINMSNDGIVEATGSGNAINSMGKFSTVTVSGGTVSAKTGKAIMCDDDNTVLLSGGFVFAYGTDTTEYGDVIAMFSGVPAVTGGTICAWNKDAGNTSYPAGTTDDLATHSSGTVQWGRNGDQSGISYSVGGNIGFFPISGVSVTGPVQAPNLDSADNWARSAIQEAFSLGYIPESLQSDYTATITRAEYCAIAVRFYETFMGKAITIFADFSDTNDVNVRKLAGIEVVIGNGDGTFSPNGVFTREQMAVITVRLLQALGISLPAANPTFSDMDQAETWARSYIGQVQAAGVMSGVGDNRFDPKSNLDRQSAIMLTLNILMMHDAK